MIDRRLEPRHLFACPIDAVSSTTGNGDAMTISGTTLNISAGGLCLRSDRYIEPRRLLAARIHFAESPVGIPVLMQVQWILRDEGRGDAWRAGLRFLL